MASEEQSCLNCGFLTIEGHDLTQPLRWLGHESIETTNLYLHVNLDMTETALAKIQPMDTPFRRFHLGDRLLAFKESLGGCPL